MVVRRDAMDTANEVHKNYMGIGQIRRHIADANLAGNN